jgi:2',3'-cyclic-nucleotide 2'-phosphodiesterase (5'-nucleotidase family)
MVSRLPKASTIIERGGIRIGVVGLTHPGVRKLLTKDPGLGSKLRVLDPIAAARIQITKLLREVDFVIVLSNLGELRDRQLTSKVNGIGAIISGFDRKIIDPPDILLNGVPRDRRLSR